MESKKDMSFENERIGDWLGIIMSSLLVFIIVSDIKEFLTTLMFIDVLLGVIILGLLINVDNRKYKKW